MPESLYQIQTAKRPGWLKVRFPLGPRYARLSRLVREGSLHTVCESASCPNIGECWNAGTLTVMILGSVCTRSCGFCDVETGRPGPLDPGEPERVAHLLAALRLRYAVITSVNRDELPDDGSGVWAETIRQVRRRCPETGIEVLVPDFKGSFEALNRVLEAGPDVLGHNVETVPMLYERVRPQAKYERSLSVLRRAKQSGFETKTGLMLGIGEREEEVVEVMDDLRCVGCNVLTLGQYLQPSRRHIPVDRFVHPDEFLRLKEIGEAKGFRHVESAPLVRSSYRADRYART